MSFNPKPKSTKAGLSASRARVRLIAANLVFAALTALSLTGCPSPNNSSTINNRGGTAAGQAANSAGISPNGVVYLPAGQQAAFTQVIADFVGAMMDPQYLGDVSVNASDSTGVVIGGKVALSGGTGSLRAAVGGQNQITNDSSVYIAIYDNRTGKRDANGVVIDPIGRFFNNASGVVSGNTAHLQFQDDYGSLTLDGQFDQNQFSGTVHFDNDTIWDSSGQTHAGSLLFQVPTCQFFNCN